MKQKKIEFSRHGKCPICNKPFMSDVCKHDFGYVVDVVNQANRQLDVNRVLKNRKG